MSNNNNHSLEMKFNTLTELQNELFNNFLRRYQQEDPSANTSKVSLNDDDSPERLSQSELVEFAKYAVNAGDYYNDPRYSSIKYYTEQYKQCCIEDKTYATTDLDSNLKGFCILLDNIPNEHMELMYSIHWVNSFTHIPNISDGFYFKCKTFPGKRFTVIERYIDIENYITLLSSVECIKEAVNNIEEVA